ncbi:hypothetical protein A6E01_20105 (plasmid) [Vibrio breoganii]|uniref:DUF306 domain-containing protein n=1 Tax=Vibrio breoganii TaxID=553239 RepID=A0AAN0XZI5_9VIBR|nr:META domain-containing protein [Vibrio breoganii]ANO35519.1 hypothetical protein A6E01_20105 [Vibrio breoganii]PML13828.1 hypothetical protein BCT84_12620 [Vibrio breoganii]
MSTSAQNDNVATQSLAGQWTLVSVNYQIISGQSTIPEINIDHALEVSGNTGCNTISGHAEVNGKSMRFTHLGGSKLLCEPGAMRTEKRLTETLSQWSHMTITRGSLFIRGKGNMLEFSRDYAVSSKGNTKPTPDNFEWSEIEAQTIDIEHGSPTPLEDELF